MADVDKHFLHKIITGDKIWCFACDPETKRQISKCVGQTFPRPKKLKFQRSHIKIMLIIFFDSQGVMHKEFVPEGKTVNAEFYKGLMDSLLKRIHRFVQMNSALEIFSCCTIMLPPTKLQVFANCWPKKCYNPLSLPVLSRFISARLFPFPQVKNEVKRTPLCGCCWDPRRRK